MERTRGRLGDRQAQCPWLRLASLSGLSPLLRRLRISFQQGRRHVHSPALNYQPKRQAVERQLAAHWAAQEAGWNGWLPQPTTPGA